MRGSPALYVHAFPLGGASPKRLDCAVAVVDVVLDPLATVVNWGTTRTARIPPGDATSGQRVAASPDAAEADRQPAQMGAAPGVLGDPDIRGTTYEAPDACSMVERSR